jgi:hypothetical protein
MVSYFAVLVAVWSCVSFVGGVTVDMDGRPIVRVRGGQVQGRSRSVDGTLVELFLGIPCVFSVAVTGFVVARVLVYRQHK